MRLLIQFYQLVLVTFILFVQLVLTKIAYGDEDEMYKIEATLDELKGKEINQNIKFVNYPIRNDYYGVSDLEQYGNCVKINTSGSVADSDHSYLLVNAEANIPYEYNSDRFGMLNINNGKQFLRFIIKDPYDSHDIIGASSNLQLGTTSLKFKNKKNHREYQVCFANVASDFSWNRLNSNIDVAVEIIDKTVNYKQILNDFSKRINNQIEESLSNVLNETSSSIFNEYGTRTKLNLNKMLQIETKIRNLYEIIYTDLLFSLLLYLVTSISLSIIVVYILNMTIIS